MITPSAHLLLRWCHSQISTATSSICHGSINQSSISQGGPHSWRKSWDLDFRGIYKIIARRTASSIILWAIQIIQKSLGQIWEVFNKNSWSLSSHPYPFISLGFKNCTSIAFCGLSRFWFSETPSGGIGRRRLSREQGDKGNQIEHLWLEYCVIFGVFWDLTLRKS
jgi:hypothetical protein